MLKLLDNTEKIKREIETLEDPCWHEKLNGLNVLEFTTLDRDIKNKDRVVFQDELGIWHEFIVESIDDTHEDVFVYCEDSFYETRGDYIDDRRFVNANFATVAQAVMSYTRWNCKILGDLGKGTVNFYRTSVKSAVFEDMQNKFDFEIKTYVEITNSRISQRVIELRKQRGHDNGKRFTYDKDIDSISRTIDSTEFCTALYAYGKGEETENGGYGRRIDISKVNNGKKYVENTKAKEQFGKYVKGKREHIFATYIFGDIDDRKKLLEQAKKKLEELSEFKVTYKCDVLVLNKLLEDRQHEGIELGDTVAIIDKDINIRIRARVVERKSYLNSTKADEIVLGNFIEDYATQQAKIKSDLKSISNTINEQGQAITDLKNFDYYASIVQELNDRINATGGYVYISKDGQGLITYDKPIDKNPTKAIQLKGGAIRIANSKKSDGSWNWTTFGTGDGFTADKIIAGILQGGKVRWNLEDGTFLIGNSISDYSFYWDGSTLHMKDVDIDLTNNNVVKEISKSVNKNNEDIKKANDAITQTQTSVQVLKDSISSKVSKTEILSDKEIQNALKGRDGADGANGSNGSNFTWNLLRKSNISVTNAAYPLISYKLSEKPIVGETYTCTIWGKLGDGKRGFRAFNSGGYVSLGGYSKKLKEGLYQITFNWENDKYGHIADDTELTIYPFDSSVKVESTIDKIKLEKGINTNPVWSPHYSEIKGEKGDKGEQGLRGLQGKDGKNGIPGKAGADGKTPYLHIAYSNSADGSKDFSVTDSKRDYIGQYTDFFKADSTDYKKYSWSKIKGEFEGEIGGRNLLKNSDDLSDCFVKHDGGNHTITDAEIPEFGISGKKVQALVGNKTDATKDIMLLDTENLIDGKVYTFSMYIKNTRDVPMKFSIKAIESGLVTIKPKEIKRIVVTGKKIVDENANGKFRVFFNSNTKDYYLDCIVAHPQLEEGDVATSWSKNPSDFISENQIIKRTFEAYQEQTDRRLLSTVSQTDFNKNNVAIQKQFSSVDQKANGIISTVSSNYKDLSKKIDGKPSTTTVQSLISQKVDSVKIEVSNQISGVRSSISVMQDNIKLKANKTDLYGLVSFKDLQNKNSYTVINGDNIKTGKISTADGSSWINLKDGNFSFYHSSLFIDENVYDWSSKTKRTRLHTMGTFRVSYGDNPVIELNSGGITLFKEKEGQDSKGTNKIQSNSNGNVQIGTVSGDGSTNTNVEIGPKNGYVMYVYGSLYVGRNLMVNQAIRYGVSCEKGTSF